LVNPVPVSLARALGAGVVIAVDLNSELVGRRFGELSVSNSAPAAASRIPEWLDTALGPLLGRVLQASRGHPSYFEVLANSLNIMQDRITRSRLAGDPPDVLLRPAVGNFSWLDFHRATEAIAEGAACVRAAREAIERACRSAHVAVQVASV
jgi:NTE family protein